MSYRNHYYLIPDLMKIADEKMYEDKKKFYEKRDRSRTFAFNRTFKI